MSIVPNIQGFRDAQDRLRDELGQDITFQVPVEKVYADDVALDPESGEPYDPTTVPISGGEDEEVVVRATVVFHPIQSGEKDDVVSEPIGPMSTQNVALLVGAAQGVSIASATGFELNGRNFRITDIVPDGLLGIDRYIVYGQAR